MNGQKVRLLCPRGSSATRVQQRECLPLIRQSTTRHVKTDPVQLEKEQSSIEGETFLRIRD